MELKILNKIGQKIKVIIGNLIQLVDFSLNFSNISLHIYCTSFKNLVK